MRLFLILIGSALFFSASIAYELSDFRIPTHTAKQLTLSSEGWLSETAVWMTSQAAESLGRKCQADLRDTGSLTVRI